MPRHRENTHSTQYSRRCFGRARTTFYYSKGIFLNHKTFSNFSPSPPSLTESVSLAFNVSCCTKTVFFFLSFSCRFLLFRLHFFASQRSLWFGRDCHKNVDGWRLQMIFARASFPARLESEWILNEWTIERLIYNIFDEEINQQVNSLLRTDSRPSSFFSTAHPNELWCRSNSIKKRDFNFYVDEQPLMFRAHSMNIKKSQCPIDGTLFVVKLHAQQYSGGGCWCETIDGYCRSRILIELSPHFISHTFSILFIWCCQPFNQRSDYPLTIYSEIIVHRNQLSSPNCNWMYWMIWQHLRTNVHSI